MPNLSYCAQQVRRDDNDRFLCALFAPPEKREALFALYALDMELARIPERVTEPLLGQMRYQWWHDILKDAFAGREPLGHEVVTPVAEAIRAHGLASSAFETLVETRTRDLETRPLADGVAFDDYITGTAGTLANLALNVLGVTDDATRRAAGAVARGWAIVRVIRSVPYFAARGRVFLSASALGDGIGDVLAGRNSPGLQSAVAALAEEAEDHLTAAGRDAGMDIPAAQPVLLLSVLARGQLKRIRRCGCDPFNPALRRPSPAKTLRLWYHARRGTF